MATYRLKARRYLRRYTADSPTPAYAAASDAATASAMVWRQPWTEVAEDLVAVFPSHDEGSVDLNAAARDHFDAAEWCGEHAGGMHRAYAQMACYRMVLPEAFVGRRMSALGATVSSDPYNPAGARLALAMNSTGVVPESMSEARTGLVCAASIAPRRAEAAEDGGESWYSASAETVLVPPDGTMERYLYLFVSLENYDRSRAGWVEGASALAPEIVLELGSEVPGFADGSEVDCRSEGDREFAVCRGGVLPYLLDEDRYVRSYECLAAGGDLPAAREFSPQRTDAPGVWRGSTKLIALSGDARGVRICPSGLLQLQMSGSSRVYERVVAVLGVTRAESQTEWLPGIAFYAGGYSTAPAQLASYGGSQLRFMSLAASDIGASTMDEVREALSGYFTSNLAYQDLARGTATGVSFVDNIYGEFNQQYYTRVACRDLLVFISGANGVNLLGCLRLVGSVYYHNAVGGSSASGVKFIPCTSAASAVEGDARYLLTTQDRATAYSSLFTMSGGRFTWYQEWLFMLFNTYSAVCVGDSAVTITGHDPVPYEGTVLGVSPYAGSSSDSFIVFGDLRSVGGRRCRNVAIVSCRAKAPTVWIPSVDDAITPDTYEHYQVNTVWGGEAGREKFIVTGTFGTLSGRPFAGSAIADSSTGSVAGDVAGARDHATVLACAALSDSVVWYVTGNHVRNFTARAAADLAIPAPAAEQTCVGLRHAYAKFRGGRFSKVPVAVSAQPGAAYTVRRASVSVPSTADGVSEGTTAVDMWRVSETACVVPFSTPDGFRANRVRLDWGCCPVRATAGSAFQVWLRRGEYLLKCPDELVESAAAHDGGADSLGGWERVGSVDAASETRTAEFAVGEIGCGVGTFALVAYIPQERIAEESGRGPWGVGEMDADGVNGTVSGFDTGWRPDITLIG